MLMVWASLIFVTSYEGWRIFRAIKTSEEKFGSFFYSKKKSPFVYWFVFVCDTTVFLWCAGCIISLIIVDMRKSGVF